MKFTKLKVNDVIEEQLRKRYLAFDTETTGLSAGPDRIVELGAVSFVGGIMDESFGTLVNPGIHISESAMAVNGITNSMVECAPCECEVYPRFMCYLERTGVLSGDTILVAHNANFDIGFLKDVALRHNLDGDIRYCDTLMLSRRKLPKLMHHRQCDVAEYYNIKNRNAHRAVEDAEVCGKILWEMIRNEV